MVAQSLAGWITRARAGLCPACGLGDLIAGPWGGASRNVFCTHCMVRWNLHGVAYGIIEVDHAGTATPEDVQHARNVYRDQPFRLEIEHGAPPNRDHEA